MEKLLEFCLLFEIFMNSTHEEEANSSSASHQWIHLNIGGQPFITTRMTLSHDEHSLLYKMCNNDPSVHIDQDDNGVFLIDRDSTYFGPILNYLRHGKLILDQNMTLSGILAEAEYYQLTGLSQLVKQKIKERNDQGNEKKAVYRVLQCSEEELTQMMSTLSDGWKFEQLVNAGPTFGDDKPEFLCVVSKECPLVADGVQLPATDRVKVLQDRGSRI